MLAEVNVEPIMIKRGEGWCVKEETKQKISEQLPRWKMDEKRTEGPGCYGRTLTRGICKIGR